MSTTDEVIGSIDHALRDFATGPDAMRWTPEPPPEGWRVAPVAWPQVTFAADISGFQAAIERARDAFRPMFEAVLKLALAFSQLPDPASDARRTRLHTTYRARSRRRTRRNR
jgi:hypothetical protein